MKKIKNKYTIITLLLIVVASLTLPCLIERPKNNTGGKLYDIELHYAIVDHVMMGDKGMVDKLLYIDSQKVGSLMKIWKFKANKECIFNENLSKQVFDLFYKTLGKNNKKAEEKRDEARDVFDTCQMDFVYRNWDDINKTILNTYRLSKKERCPYCLFYKLFY